MHFFVVVMCSNNSSKNEAPFIIPCNLLARGFVLLE